jgi:hypothetical protein
MILYGHYELLPSNIHIFIKSRWWKKQHVGVDLFLKAVSPSYIYIYIYVDTPWWHTTAGLLLKLSSVGPSLYIHTKYVDTPWWHTTAGLLLKLSRVGPSQSLDGRPDAAGSGVGGPVGGTLSSGLKKISQCPRAVIGDTAALCSVLSFGWDVKRVSWLFEVIKVPMALIVRVGVLSLVSWLSEVIKDPMALIVRVGVLTLVSWLSEVIKDPMALIVRVGVLTLVSWLHSQFCPQTIMVT